MKYKSKSKNTFYHNHNYGDICQECYNEKKKLEEKKIKTIKSLILLQGKRVVFSKMLEQTKKYLKNNKIKSLNLKQKLVQCNNINKTLLEQKECIPTCKICFEYINLTKN